MIRFQQYPDGAASWRLFLWSHWPKDSRVWTHTLNLACYRWSSEAYRWPMVIRTRRSGGQWRYGIACLCFVLEMGRQDAEPRGMHRPHGVVQ